MKRLLLVSFISLSVVSIASAQTGKKTPPKNKQRATATYNQKMLALKNANVNSAPNTAKDLQISKGVLNTTPANRR